MQNHTTIDSPPPPSIHIARVDSPIGRIELTSDGTSITSLAIERDGHLPHDGQPEASTAVIDTAIAQLSEYFAGSRREFDVPVTLGGTDFQRSVWRELTDIPFGEVASYGEIGMATGRPTAGRAVGGAVGANPVPIIIPCHRVLAAGGKVGGFSGSGGIGTKRRILAIESRARLDELPLFGGA